MSIVTSTSTASTMCKPFGAYSNVGVKYERESTQELTEKANLNWKTVLAPIAYSVNEESYQSTSDYVITREDDPKINFGTCGKRWQPLQNQDVLSGMIRFCNESKGLVKLERVGSFKQGKSIWALATTDKEFELLGGDKVTGNILLVDHHSAGKGLQVNLLTWRQVCSNGLTLPVTIGKKVFAHTTSLTSSSINLILHNSFNSFAQFQENSTLLSQTPIDLKVVYSFVISHFGNKSEMNLANPVASNLDKQPKAVKQILRLYAGAGQGSDMISSYNTAWGCLNACTEYLNHESIQKGGIEGHINSLWLEGKAAKQRKVYTQLVSLVGV
jgi:phage/plasmid-like protein (TIGR03299 family)